MVTKVVQQCTTTYGDNARGQLGAEKGDGRCWRRRWKKLSSSLLLSFGREKCQCACMHDELMTVLTLEMRRRFLSSSHTIWVTWKRTLHGTIIIPFALSFGRVRGEHMHNERAANIITCARAPEYLCDIGKRKGTDCL